MPQRFARTPGASRMDLARRFPAESSAPHRGRTWYRWQDRPCHPALAELGDEAGSGRSSVADSCGTAKSTLHRQMSSFVSDLSTAAELYEMRGPGVLEYI